MSIDRQGSSQGGVASAYQRYNLSFVDNETLTLPHVLPTVDEYILVSLFAASLITCIIVICILSRWRTSNQNRTGTGLYASGHLCMLVNLAASDMCFLVTALPATLIYNSDTYSVFSEPMGAVVCSAVHYVIYVTCYVSMYTMVVTSVFLLCTELVGQWTLLSRRSASISCVIIWAAFLVANISTLIRPPSIEFLACSVASSAAPGQDSDDSYVGNHGDHGGSISDGRKVWITFLVFAFLLPLTVISVLSAIILQCQRRREARGMTSVSRHHPHPHAGGGSSSTPHTQTQRQSAGRLQERQVLQSSACQLLLHQTPSSPSHSTAASSLAKQHQQQRCARLQQFVYRNENLEPAVDLGCEERRLYSPSHWHGTPASSSSLQLQFIRRDPNDAFPVSSQHPSAINDEGSELISLGMGRGKCCMIGTINSAGGVVAAGDAPASLPHHPHHDLAASFQRDCFSTADSLPSASMHNSPVCDLLYGDHHASGCLPPHPRCAEMETAADGSSECHHCGHSLQCHWNKSRSADDGSQSGTGTGTDADVTIINVQQQPAYNVKRQQQQASMLSSEISPLMFGDTSQNLVTSSPFTRQNYATQASDTGLGEDKRFTLYDNARLRYPAPAVLHPHQSAASGKLEHFDEELEGIPKMPVFTTVAGKAVNGGGGLVQRSLPGDKRYASGNPRLQSSIPPLPPPRFDATSAAYVSFDGTAATSSSNNGSPLYDNNDSFFQHQYSAGLTRQGIQPSQYEQLTSGDIERESNTTSLSSGHRRYRYNQPQSHPQLDNVAQSPKRCNGHCASSKPHVTERALMMTQLSDTLTLSTVTSADDRSVMTSSASTTNHAVTCGCCVALTSRPTPDENDLRRHKEMTILVMATAVTRTLCWFPFQMFIISSVYDLIFSVSAHNSFGAFAVCLVFISPCFSPFIYFASSLDFRRLFQSIFSSEPNNDSAMPKCPSRST